MRIVRALIFPLFLTSAGFPLAAGARDVSTQRQLDRGEAFQRVDKDVATWEVPEVLKLRLARFLKDGILDAYFEKDQGQGLSPASLDRLLAAMKGSIAWRRAEWEAQRDDGKINPDERARLDGLRRQFEQDIRDLRPDALRALYLEKLKTLGSRPQAGHGSGGSGGSCLRNWVPGKCIARYLHENGKGKDALDELNEVLSKDPRNIEALEARAQLNAELGRLAEANADAREVLELDPTDKAAFAIYKLTEGRGNVQPQASPAQPASPGAWSGGLGGLARSPVTLNADASSVKNHAASGAVKAAMDALRMGDMPAAIAHLDRALEADARSLDAYRLRAMAYARLGGYDAALRDAEAGLSLSPRDAGLLIAKAFAQNRRKDFRGAMETAGLAREIDPGSVDALANFAYALGGLGDRERMLALLEEAARRDARYAASLESARGRTAGSDILFLFPGEAPAGGSQRPYGAARENLSGRNRRFGLLAAAVLVGGFLVALGLLQAVAVPLTMRVRSAWTRGPRPAVAGAPAAEDRAAPRLPGLGDGLLRGQYRVLRQIGAGGMGVVYEGSDVSLSRRVAIKKMRDELRLDRRERMRFINEAKLVASLHHPNIVDIYAVVEEGDDIFLVFEFVNGRTVYDLIGGRGGLGFHDALGVCRGMAAALDFAHGRNIVHRDLKPSNVMISDEGFVKVMDFGIARLAKDTALRFSMTNTVAGTPPYMAPEQEQGIVRREADVYALAVCVYEMLCGKAPFAGTGAGMLMNKVNMSYIPVSRMAPGLPAGLDEVFARAFQADPDKRFHAARDFIAALEALPAASRGS